MKVSEFVRVFPEKPVVLIEHDEDFDGLTADEVYEAVNCDDSDYRDPLGGDYAGREVECADWKRYQNTDCALVIRLKAPVAA